MNKLLSCLTFGILAILAKLETQIVDAKQLVIAHRGASGYLPEHTHEAKVAAFIMGADYLEQDLVLTKDNIPIVSHDIHLDEVTNVADMFPERKRADSRYYAIDFTYDEIKTLKVSERFHHDNRSQTYFPLRFPSWQSEFAISSFEDEIQLIQGMETSFGNIYKLDKNGHLTYGLVRKAGIYPEIKNPAFHYTEGHRNFSEIVLEILHKYGYRAKSDPVFLQTFDPIELKRIHDNLGSKHTLIQLMPVNTPPPSEPFDWNSVAGLRKIAEFAHGIGPDIKMLFNLNLLVETGKVEPTDFFHEAKRLGLLIHPYTLRIDNLAPGIDYETMLKIVFDELKCDGVFTDFPDLTSQYLKLKNDADRRISTCWMSLFSVLFVAISIAFD